LNNLSGDGKVGAHGTRVELKWNNNLEYVGASGQSPEPLVPGHRLQHLSLVNESGQKHIPLHVGIVGNDKVLNNGTVSGLKLRITNLVKPDPMKPGEGNIVLNQGPDPKQPPPTKFIFSFDAGSEADPWALGKISDVKKIEIRAVNKPFNTPSPTEQGQSVQWTMWPMQTITLGPGESIDFTIGEIKTNHPSGLSNLYIHYKNIPGYWDGNFVALIEKAPLVYANTGVGIGVDPKATLHVKGNVRAENLFVSPTGSQGAGIPTPADALHVVGDTFLGKWPTQIKCTSDDHRLIFDVDCFEIREQNAIVFSPGSINNQQTAKTVIAADGNVGIGAPDPKKHLHVAGTGEQEILIESTDPHGAGKWALKSSGGGEAANKIWRETGRFDIINHTAKESRLTIERDGNVGIGTIWPGHLINEGNYFKADSSGRILEVHSPGHEGVLILSSGQDADGANLGGVYFTRTSGQSDAHREVAAIKCTQATAGKTAGGVLQFFTKPALDGFNSPRMVIKENGRVGIGTNTPAVPLHVMGGQANSFTLARWMDDVNLGANGGERSDLPHSIIAEKRIRAAAFDTVSDARVKNVLGASAGASDLDALLKIIITDYTYKDVIGKGGGTYKKVIGQQIERVFPQAVSKCKDVVPDIYQQAPIHDGWISIATDLKKGDRVKLIVESGTENIHEVLEVTSEKFRVDLEPEGEKVFVYGREVDDFLTVDYDAISMLNVSATQQLKKEMDQELNALRAENAELRAANEALAKRLQLLESKIEATLSMSAGVGSNGNGRH
jgi:hypothetical protein